MNEKARAFLGLCDVQAAENTSHSVAVLRACAKAKDLLGGVCVHALVLREGMLEMSSDALVSMYAQCGALSKAQNLLDELPVQDLFSWTTLIAGYAQQSKGQEALHCLEMLQCTGLSPDAVTFTCILKACGSIGALHKGEEIHDVISKQGLLANNIMLGNAVVDMYAKCGELTKARQVLEELPVRDLISWNTLISGYVQQGQGDDALDCFERSQHEGLSPNAVTYSCILKACGSIGAANKGEQIHDLIQRQGLLSKNVVLGTALVDMYAKCGALAKAQQVLKELTIRDIVSWSVIITGYAQRGQGEEALNCYERMQQEGLFPNSVTLLSILKACGSIGAIGKGEKIHEEIVRQGLLGEEQLGNALVDMYAKCGALAKARHVLERLPARNVVSWNALIAGCAQHGRGEESLLCYDQMLREDLFPNAVTLLCILKACGILGAIDMGEQIHDEIARQGLLGKHVVLGNALVDMYCKCGSTAKAQRVLEDLPVRDVVSWNSLIAGYVEQGCSQETFECFWKMQHEGACPDAVTMSSVLNACIQSGLVDKGKTLFDDMSAKFGVYPDLEHYIRMVDLFGYAGYLDKAIAVIYRMPSSDSIAWSSILGASRKWGDASAARWAFDNALRVA